MCLPVGVSRRQHPLPTPMGLADLDDAYKAYCPGEKLRVTVALARPGGAATMEGGMLDLAGKPACPAGQRGFWEIHTCIG